MIKRDFFKDLYTDFVGYVVLALTIYSVYFKEMPWLWDGVAGILVGVVFVIVPDAVVKKILINIVNKWIKK